MQPIRPVPARRPPDIQTTPGENNLVTHERRKMSPAMGIIVAGFLLIGVVVLVLFGETLNKIMEEPAEHRTAPSTPDGNQAAGKLQTGPTQPEIPDHL